MSGNFSSKIVWATPSVDATGSMPLGNGEVAANVWVDCTGRVGAYLARGDCWGEFGQLYKTGKVTVWLGDGDGPLLEPESLRWELDLETGSVLMSSRRGWLRVWADAHYPCLHFLAEGVPGFDGELRLEVWRTQRRELDGPERHGLHTNAPYAVWHGADLVAELEEDAVAWLHWNSFSTWRANLESQGLGELAAEGGDPLMHRAFGGLARGAGLRKKSARLLKGKAAGGRWMATVTLLTRHPSTPEKFLEELKRCAWAVPAPDDPEAWEGHCRWWRNFWERSWIVADGCEAARKVSRGYALQRFMNACAGRGQYPIKFNGSLFAVDWHFDGENFDADYRRWGPGYWHQNTRLPYWGMLAAGDYDLMQPYFGMYREALPLARERCRKFCGHEGAFFPETMYFWGGYLENNYGWPGQREEGLPGHLAQNRYIRRHFSGGLEVVYQALLYYRHTGDEDFLSKTALPLAEAVLDFYDFHYPREGGKIFLSPAQVLEQWWEAENPLPEIAGLWACLEGLLALPERMVAPSRRAQWGRLLGELPALPLESSGEKPRFAPAARWQGPPRNTENPELYAVFPYHRCHLGTADVEIGRETFFRRAYPHDEGWAQDGIQAALLGLTESALYSVRRRLTQHSAYARFPAFWGPNFDWIPDIDQGSAASLALQLMCLHGWEERCEIFPAWPVEWSCGFRLHAPGGQVVEANYSPGKGVEVLCEPRQSCRIHL